MIVLMIRMKEYLEILKGIICVDQRVKFISNKNQLDLLNNLNL